MLDLKLKISGDSAEAREALQRLQAEARATARALAESAAAPGEKTEQTKKETLAYAQSLARLQQSAGDTAGALETLSNAIANSDRQSAESLRAQSQLAALLAKSLADAGEEGERAMRKLGNQASGSTRIIKEGFITVSSEIIESWGVDGDIANELAKMFFKLPPQAQAALATVAVAFLTAAAVAGTLALAISKIIDTAEKVGTQSKDDFEEFSKALKDAGFVVTDLDRRLGQGLTRAVKTLKSTTDGLFLDVTRESGPEFIQLLRTMTKLLGDMRPLATGLGKILAEVFSLASALFKTFSDNKGLFATAGAFALPTGGLTVGLAGAFKAPELFANLQAAREEAAKLSAKLPAATFDGGGDAKNNTDAIRNQIALLQLREQAAERSYQEETNAAQRALDLRLSTQQEFTKRAIAAEEKLLTAKLATIQAESELVGKDGAAAGDQQVTRAELQERELQSLSDFRAKITKLRDDQAQADSDAIDRTLDNTRKAAEARRRLNREIQQIRLAAQALRLDAAQTSLQRDQAVPGAELQEIQRKRELLIQAAELRSERTRTELQFRIAELEFAELSYAEKLEKEKAFNRELAAERKRAGEELAALRVQGRAEELQLQGFEGGQAAAIAEQEALLERQTRLFEQLKTSAKASFLEIGRSAQGFGQIVGGALRSVLGATQQMFAAFILTGKGGGAAFRQLAAETIAALAVQSGVKAIFELAEGFAALAQPIPDVRAATAHFTAAKIYGTVAAVAGGVGLAIGAAGGLGGGSAAASANAGVGGAVTGRVVPEQVVRQRQLTAEERERADTAQGLRDRFRPGQFFDGVTERLADAVEGLNSKITAMRPGEVVARGASENPRAIGQAVLQAGREDGGFVRQLSTIQGIG